MSTVNESTASFLVRFFLANTFELWYPNVLLLVISEGFGNFSFNMDLYRSGKYVSPYKVSEYPVAVHPFGQLYCETKLDTSDSGLILFADKCVATPSMNPNHHIQYIFIDNG